MNKKIDVLCLKCYYAFKEPRQTKREKELNPRRIEYCPVCNTMTNHMSVKKFDQLLAKLDINTPKTTQDKGQPYVKKRGV